MGRHISHNRPPFNRSDSASHGTHGGPGYDGYAQQGYDLPGYHPKRRIPSIFVIAALAVWTLLALGTWVVIDPLLAWAGVLVAPLLETGSAVGDAVGIGKEVGAVIDASGAESIAQWLLGVLSWLAKPAIVIVWALGVGAILLAQVILARGIFSRRY
ncbi:MAG: hypothetical protein DI533_05550 [Cereibacter sphaeroides]|uniref:Uncharacterized protein n=1 Tax=Cereibacter sphaeroides TaxID=1063 RepID=A0A2W5SKA5_CERSP|nr:MAG: hypothetical protein DI533_05550 [Cereibacter sphaeroides]